MAADWERHCPIEKGEAPIEREAWRKGWTHRKSPDKQAALNVMGTPLLLSVWLEGYSAAGRHERSS